jgi:hypothetical protein
LTHPCDTPIPWCERGHPVRERNKFSDDKQAQNVEIAPGFHQPRPGLWYKLAEKFDERQLRYDQARLQEDIRRGDTARANRDLEELRRDEWWLAIDRNGPQSGPLLALSQQFFFLKTSSVSHPQYPGLGYYPCNPGQRYQFSQPFPALIAAPGGGASSSRAPGSTPATKPREPVSVMIRNTEQSGVAVSYVVDGVVYKTESGGLERLVAGTSSTILYDRGGAFGVQRYALSAGEYEFRSSDTGWALVKLRPMP